MPPPMARMVSRQCLEVQLSPGSSAQSQKRLSGSDLVVRGFFIAALLVSTGSMTTGASADRPPWRGPPAGHRRPPRSNATPGDFGTRGDTPSHPELLGLSGLAVIARGGWSIKQIAPGDPCSPVLTIFYQQQRCKTHVTTRSIPITAGSGG